MKFLNKAILSLTVLTIIVSSCGKYEEGPGISLRSKKARAANTWKMEDLYIGEDKMDPSVFEGFKLKLDKDGNFQELQDETLMHEGKWEFSEDKMQLIFDQDEEDGYTILKLKNKEMWLENTDTVGGDPVIVEYHFVEAD